MKFKFICFLFFLSSFCFAKVSISYSESADVFEVVDQVSRWHPSISSLMQDEWIKVYGGVHTDFDMWKKIREKYQTNSVPKEKGLFEKADIYSDPFSFSFHSSKSVGEALKKLSKKLTDDELKFLQSFFKDNIKNISFFLKESTTFKSSSKEWESLWKKEKLEKVLDRAFKFLGQRRSPNIYIRPVWWPSNHRQKIDRYGNVIIFRLHPLSGLDLWNGKEFVASLIKSYLETFPHNDNVNYKKIFDAQCSDKAQSFENALILSWSKVFVEKEKLKKGFSYHQIWSNNPFDNVYTKLIAPLLLEELNQKNLLSISFINKAAAVCAELKSIQK